MAITPVQPVVTKAEKFALELAEMLMEDRKPEAQDALQTFAKQNGCVYWEVVAIARMAVSMQNGKRWKKDA